METENKDSAPQKNDIQEILTKSANLDKKSWKLIEKIVLTQAKQNRWAGFGRWIFRFTVLVFIILMSFGIPQRYHPAFSYSASSTDHIAKIQISGVISEGSAANAKNINSALKKAFEAKSSKAIVLSISSPGGSPVQSDLVWNTINQLKAIHDKPVYAVIGDIGASGAYYIASAADHIYANANSLVGSIGVINSSFGFKNLINELGIERRVITSGEHKALLDPFDSRSEFATQHMTALVNKIHDRFREVVIHGRQDRLNQQKIKEIFSGLVWIGKDAMELGLIDGLKSIEDIANEVEEGIKIIDYSKQPSPFDRLTNRFGQVIAEALFSANSPKPSLY